MIRKSILYTGLIFIILWFTGSYFIKYRITSILRQLETESVKITYDKLLVSGFPAMWRIELVAPQVQLIDRAGTYNLLLPRLLGSLDINLKKLKLSLGNSVEYQRIIKGQTRHYRISAIENNIEFLFKFATPLYRLPRSESEGFLINIIELFELVTNPYLVINDGAQDIFNIKDLKILVSNNLLANSSRSEIKLKMKADYQTVTQNSESNLAMLDFDSLIKISDIHDLHCDKEFNIHSFYVSLDDAKVRIHGTLESREGKLPQGKFFVNLDNYNKIIDKLIPENFTISKTMLKQLLSNLISVNSTIEDITSTPEFYTRSKAEFGIIFSEQGVKIEPISPWAEDKIDSVR